MAKGAKYFSGSDKMAAYANKKTGVGGCNLVVMATKLPADAFRQGGQRRRQPEARLADRLPPFLTGVHTAPCNSASACIEKKRQAYFGSLDPPNVLAFVKLRCEACPLSFKGRIFHTSVIHLCSTFREIRKLATC